MGQELKRGPRYFGYLWHLLGIISVGYGNFHKTTPVFFRKKYFFEKTALNVPTGQVP